MSQRKAEFVLTILVLVNSSAFLFTKMGMGSIDPMGVVSARMLIGFAPLALVFLPRLLKVNLKTLGVAAVLGVFICSSMALQAHGLHTVSTSEGSFLASTTVVWVPVIMAMFSRRLPARAVAVSVALTIGGIALICGAGSGSGLFAFTPGTAMFLAAAVLYALHIIVVDQAGEGVDMLAATILEMLFAGVIALVANVAFETPQLPADPQAWVALLALGLFSTAIGFGFQPLVQQFTSAERYGVLFGLSPLFATFLGVLVLNESLSTGAILGATLVLAGVMVSELSGTSLAARTKRLVRSYMPLGRVMARNNVKGI